MTELRDYVDLENPKMRKFAAKQQVAGIELLSPDSDSSHVQFALYRRLSVNAAGKKAKGIPLGVSTLPNEFHETTDICGLLVYRKSLRSGIIASCVPAVRSVTGR